MKSYGEILGAYFASALAQSLKDTEECTEKRENGVNHPDHYCKGRMYEPKDVIRDWGLNFNLGNVVKYVSRAGRKDSRLEDLEKAKNYLQFEIDALKEEETMEDEQ